MALEERGSVGTGRQLKSPCVTLASSAWKSGGEMTGDAAEALGAEGQDAVAGKGGPGGGQGVIPVLAVAVWA